jgi:putative membrane protein
MFKSIPLFVLAAAIPVGAQQAQQTAPPPTPPASQMAQTAKTAPAISDSDFLQQAALAGKLEVDLAQIAQTKSKNDKVKAIAKKIEADHTDANAQLTLLADRKDSALPGLTDEQKAAKDKFRGMSDAEFDKAWLAQMVTDHEKAIELFTKGTSATDATIRTFAESKLPALKEHLKQVKELAGS